jgi:hypothetical protein
MTQTIILTLRVLGIICTSFSLMSNSQSKVFVDTFFELNLELSTLLDGKNYFRNSFVGKKL